LRNIERSVTPVVAAVDHDHRRGNHHRGSDVGAWRSERSHDTTCERRGEAQRYQHFDDARHVGLLIRFT
jgi:hypothetical protein